MTGRRRPRQAGFTLVEIMISLTIFSVAIVGALSVAVTMVNGYREQRLAVSTEAAARGAMEYIADAVRGASPAVPSGEIQDVTTCTTGSFSVTNNTTAPDELTVVVASGAVVTSIRTDYGAGATQVTVANATEISVGDQLLITNFTQGHIVKVTSVNTATGVLGLGAQCGTIALPSGGYLAGALVIRVLRARFYVADLDGIPTLMMDPDADGSAAGEPVADGVEDFQLALGVDADGSGTLLEVGAAAGDDEWAYNVSGDAALAGSIRAVRISLVARATAKVTGTATFTRPAVEDRAAGATTDNYRRRVLSSSVEIRNLGGSP